MDGKNWKISFRVRYPYNTSTSECILFYNYTSDNERVYITATGGTTFVAGRVRGGITDISIVTKTYEPGGEYHIELISNSSGIRLFVDGEPGTLDTDDVAHIPSLKMELGNQDSGSSVRIPVQITDFRYTDATPIQCNIMAVTDKVYSGSAATVGAGVDITASVAALADQVEASAASDAIRTSQVAADVASVEAASASVLRHKASVDADVTGRSEERLTDTTFNPSFWTGFGSTTFNGDGTLDISGSGGLATNSGVTEAGKTYEYTFTVSGLGSGDSAQAYYGFTSFEPAISENGTHKVTLDPVAAGQGFGFYAAIVTGPTVTISGVSVKEVTGVQASASTKTIHTASVDAEVHGYIETNDDPDIDSPGNWTVDAGSATVDTDGIHFPGGFTYVSWPGEENIVEGESYRVTFEITNYSGTAGVTVALRNLATTFRIGNGVYSEVIVAGSGADNTTHILATNPCTCDIPYLNIEHVTGVQASASLLKGVKVASVAADVAATEANADSTNVHTASVAARLCIRTQNNTDQNIQSPGSWSTTNCTANTGEIVFANPGSNAFAYWPGYLNIKAGRTYRVVYTISDWSAGIIGVRVGGDNTNFNGANGTYEDILYATQDGTTINSGISTFPGTTAKVTFCLVEELEGVTASASSTSIHKASVGIGAEENPDVTPSTPSEWDLETYDTGDWWDLTNNKLVCSPALGNSGSGVTSQNVDLTLGRTYLLRYQCTITAGSLITYLHGTSNPGIERTSSGSYSELIVIDDATDLGAGADIVFAANAVSSDLEVWDISVREVQDDYLAPVEASASAISIHKASVGVSAELCDTTCQPANWSTGANAIPNSDGTISVLSGGGYRTATSTDPLVIGKQYLVTMTVTASANGAGALQGLSAWGTIYTSAGTYTQVLTATTTDRFGVGFSGDAGTISGISIKEVQDDYLAPVEASASSTSIHIASVDADVPQAEASADSTAIRIASVDADTTATEADADVLKGIKVCSVAADVEPTEAAGNAIAIRFASVDADVTQVEASASSTTVRVAAVDADAPETEANASSITVHVAAVDASIESVTASVSAKAIRVAAVSAEATQVEASIASTWILGSDTYTAAVAAETTQVEGTASTVTIRSCSVSAQTSQVEGSASVISRHLASVGGETDPVEGSASGICRHVAAVSGETDPAEASASALRYITAGGDFAVTPVTASAAAKAIRIASISAETQSTEAAVAAAGPYKLVSVDADLEATESASHLAVTLTCAIDADLDPVVAAVRVTLGAKRGFAHASTDPVESSASAVTIRTANIFADVSQTEAAAAGVTRRTASVTADAPETEASASVGVSTPQLLTAAVAAQTANIEASSTVRFAGTMSVDAQVQPAEAAAATQVVRICSVTAQTGPVESSAGIISTGQATISVQGQVADIEAQASVRVRRLAQVVAEAAPVEAYLRVRPLFDVTLIPECRITAVPAEVRIITVPSEDRVTVVAAETRIIIVEDC